MSAPVRLLASPVPPVGRGRLPSAAIAVLVAADVLRRAAGAGPAPSVGAFVEGGSLVAQHATERLLVKEGHDRVSLGHDAFGDRVRQLEAETRAEVNDVASVLDLPLSWPAATVDLVAVPAAARTAFVRLYDDGLIQEVERVAPVCARCVTVLTEADVEEATHEAERVTIRLVTDRGVALEVATFALEFLPGVVAVGVPAGHELQGTKATVPLTGAVVPVIGDPEVDEPVMLVPAHDPVAWAMASVRGIFAEPVLDAEGVVRAPGPLLGLGRFAGRVAARERLARSASIVRVEPGDEPAPRCCECGTAVVRVLGRHWVLDGRALSRAAADAVREGALTFTPATARDDFVAIAGAAGEWIVSSDTWGGVDVPAAVCDDCGSVAVEVRASSTCRRCFGNLVPDGRVLDARFVSACWLLAAAGWPQWDDGPWQTAAETAVVVAPAAIPTWVVPAAAVALRLAGAVPFSRVVVHDVAGPETLPELHEDDRRAARLWLAGGADDLDHARALLDGLARPGAAAGSAPEPMEVGDSIAAALEELSVASAANSLRSALAPGVPSSAAARLRRVAAIITGG